MKLVTVFVAVALAACVLAGCGGGGDEADRSRRSGEPVPSAGCGSTGVRAGRARVVLRSGGRDRWYLREVPAAHDGEKPVPVVVDLHGYAEGAAAHAEATRLGPYGGAEGFVTVTPQGQGAAPAWDTAAGSPDVAFVEDILDEVERSLCVDTARLYVAGASNGAMLASRLACEASDRVAAVAAVAGVGAVDGCGAERAVPIVAVHGTRDTRIRYDGGLDAAIAALPLPGGTRTLGDLRARPDLSIPAVMAWWARHEGCGRSPAARQVAPGIVRLRYPCADGAAVELYRIDGGGHTWPPAANELVWRFLAAQSLSAEAEPEA